MFENNIATQKSELSDAFENEKIRISEEYVVYKRTLHISYQRGAITKAQWGQKLTTTKSAIYFSVQKSHRNINPPWNILGTGSV